MSTRDETTTETETSTREAHAHGDHPLNQREGTGNKGWMQAKQHKARQTKMRVVYPPAQVAHHDPSSSSASPLITRWTKLATRAARGPAVTECLCSLSMIIWAPEYEMYQATL